MELQKDIREFVELLLSENVDFFWSEGMPPNRIDILTGIDGVDWEKVWKGRKPYVMDGLKIQVIGKSNWCRISWRVGGDRIRRMLRD